MEELKYTKKDIEILRITNLLSSTSMELKETIQEEIDHRIATSWRKFWSLKRLLLNRSVSIKQRLRLFDSTVGCCMLWCCRSWTSRVQEVKRIVTAVKFVKRIAKKKPGSSNASR
jgi:hypothetical protein